MLGVALRGGGGWFDHGERRKSLSGSELWTGEPCDIHNSSIVYVVDHLIESRD